MSSHRIMTGKIISMFQNNILVKLQLYQKLKLDLSSSFMSTEDHILTNSSRKKGSEIPEVLYQRTPGNKRRLAMDVKNLMAKVKNYYSEAGRPR